MSEDQLRSAEQDIELRSGQMGRLKAEFTLNVNNLKLAYFPKTLPYTTAVYQSNVYQQELSARIAWLEAMVVAMEQHRSSFIEGRDMAAVRRKMFADLAPALEDVFVQMEGITKDELAVLRSYDNPPQAVMDTVLTVMVVRGEIDPTWEASRVLFSETYFYTFFVSKARGRHKHADFTPEQVDAMASYVMAPALEAAAVSQVSRPCSILSQWIAVLYRFHLLSEITAPSNPPATLVSVKEALAQRRQELQQRKADIAGAQVTLEALEDELRTRLEDLRQKYDDTMVPLQEMFFDANKRFNDAYSSPRRERDARRLEADVYE